MASRTEEEERLLDEKIARIQKKNEEILRREKEIEEDKRIAAKQNAIVQLRTTSTNDSRERTPALKPSKREFFDSSVQEAGDSIEVSPKFQENATPRGRGNRRGRDRGDRSDNGPPPDPRSYLADSERDPIPPPRDGRGDEFKTNRGARQEERGSARGAREFQRGGRRGRGRPDRGRGRSEDAWRAERSRIDEERIQRQKSSDGGWRREWDSEKIEQELNEEKYGSSRGGLSQRSTNYAQMSNERSGPPEFDNRHHRGSRGPRSSRGRTDNYDHYYSDKNASPSQREQYHYTRKPLYQTFVRNDKEQQHSGKSPSTPRRNITTDHVIVSPQSSGEEPLLVRQIPNQLASPKTHFKEELGILRTIDNVTPKTILKYPTSERSVIDVGGSFKILVPNADSSESAPQASKSPRRPNNDIRHRHKSQASYSSQSEDEAHILSPIERGSRGSRNKGFGHNLNKDFNRSDAVQHIKPNDNRKQDVAENSGSNRPPLPPIKSSQNIIENKTPEPSKETEDDEESWEDVTTSGTESVGEEVLSPHSSPGGALNLLVVNSNLNENVNPEDVYTPEDFLIMQTYEGDSNENELKKRYPQGGEVDLNIGYSNNSDNVQGNTDFAKAKEDVVDVKEDIYLDKKLQVENISVIKNNNEIIDVNKIEDKCVEKKENDTGNTDDKETLLNNKEVNIIIDVRNDGNKIEDKCVEKKESNIDDKETLLNINEDKEKAVLDAHNCNTNEILKNFEQGEKSDTNAEKIQNVDIEDELKIISKETNAETKDEVMKE